MEKTIKIKKGLDIPLEGSVAIGEVRVDTTTELFGISPDDFPGYTWKCGVKPGDKVERGSVLLYAKENPMLSLVSPVSGEVSEIKRGERRKIEYVSVRKDGASTQKEFTKFTDDKSLLELLMQSGLYAMMRQRPFDIVPTTGIRPRDIFVTAFDSSPLATSLLNDEIRPYFEEGFKVLSELTSGKVYVGVREGDKLESAYALTYEFAGPHPSGNVGTQIAAIKPVNKGETVWTMDIVTVARIGRLISTGELDTTVKVALTGPEIKNPHIVETHIGASLNTLLKDELKQTDDIRVISGNVLTGIKCDIDSGFLRFPYRQITVIPEGAEADEFMGWASLDPKKYSVKRTFPAFLRGLSKPFGFDARIKGGHRAFIMSGEYDKVFPMDIYPEFLLKAIMAKDIEKMEQLGIYEVAPEDFALAEFVDTSKIELQKIVREGLNYLRKETI